ncbi:OsmC family protein [candidate division WOR-3 bacterium]|nr:OsmC family protein [candidate division WOR-3 bacterium]
MTEKPTRKVTIKQVEGLSFAAYGEKTGHWTMMDSNKSHGGSEGATSPMELLLMSLGGCTAMDVTSILSKMKQPVEDIQVEVTGTMQPNHPHAYTDIHLHYVIKGKLDHERVEHAIELSQDKYCSVSATLRAGVTITRSVDIES